MEPVACACFMRSGRPLCYSTEKPKAVIADTRFWPNPVIQAAKANVGLPLRTCHRRNPERPVNPFARNGHQGRQSCRPFHSLAQEVPAQAAMFSIASAMSEKVCC